LPLPVQAHNPPIVALFIHFGLHYNPPPFEFNLGDRVAYVQIWLQALS
jgi:hypothetical protein